jgi:uncharacterized protein
MHRLLSATLLTVALALAACDAPPRPTVNLYRAVQSGDLDQVKRHLAWGTDINQPYIDGDCPLHAAARLGSVSVARELLGHGADPLARNAAGETPLQTALLHGRTKVAQMLVREGVPLDAQGLFVELVRKGVSDRDVFDFLILRGASPNQPDAQGDAPLHMAIVEGHLAMAVRLIAYGADVNQPDGKDRLPLDLAMEQRDGKSSDGRRIIELLQRNGARATIAPGPSRNRQGTTQ